MNLLVIDGPNLNMLGIREKGIYGDESYELLKEEIQNHAKELGINVTHVQSNYEGKIIDFIQEALGNYDGIIINPGAYTHYSYAIYDALTSVKIPAVEVHISDISNREDFRKISVTAPACKEQIKGLGRIGYIKAIDYFYEGKPE